MIQILFGVILMEVVLIVMFVFKTPLRKLVILSLDRLKRGRGPIVVKTVTGTVMVVMMSNGYTMINIRNRWNEDGVINPTDQVLMAKQLLETSLMGFSLFLALMIDRLHHYIRELRIRRKSMEAVKKQSRGFEDGKTGGSEEVKALEEDLVTLRAKAKELESVLEAKTKEASDAEGNAAALKKQSEGFLLEYDRLHADNQNLRSQLQSLEQK